MNASLLDTAYEEMKKKRKPRTLQRITKDVFEIQGISQKNNSEKISQFQMDFMLSGLFICCGEDKNHIKLWDLKSRQPVGLLDKDGSYLDDFYADDDDVIKNELKDDLVFKETETDDEDEIQEKDDIEEALSDEVDEDVEEPADDLLDFDDDEDDKFDDDED